MANFDNAINLLWLSSNNGLPDWGFGSAYTCLPTLEAIHQCLKFHLYEASADAWLFWDSTLDTTVLELLQTLLAGPADVWHSGMRLALQGLPDWIDYVSPTWMLNRDPDPDIQASSWRLSLRACLIRTDVLRQLGGPDLQYQSLEAAGLELGFRYIRQGAFVQHVPDLVTGPLSMLPVAIPLADQAHFIQAGFGRRWALWAGFRAIASGMHIPTAVIQALRQAAGLPPPIQPAPYQSPIRQPTPPQPNAKVTVLIPTINRYPYLRTLLGQLRRQTVTPLEVIVVDQTPSDQRNSTLQDEFADLPLRWFTVDQAGQCSSRNLGIVKSQGNFILFLDDDVEAPSNLLELHLWNIVRFSNQVSSGVVHETDTGSFSGNFHSLRISNVFPAGNSLINKRVLEKTGLFDLAYDHGQRADGDLGMRIYLSGFLMVLDPNISILHHRASVGGLREHKARISTYAASRDSLLKLDLPTVSDLYLAKRYYSPRQVREMLWISVLGTFSIRGAWWKRLLKALISALRLPCSIWRLHQRAQKADGLLKEYPQIPHLEDPSTI
jgi:glycosyltransferase involved in cell wall biosynthesis